MALNLGQLVGGAGIVARRQSEQEMRMYQQQESLMRLQALNRAEQLRREGAWNMPTQAAPLSMGAGMGTPFRAGITAPSTAGYTVPSALMQPSTAAGTPLNLRPTTGETAAPTTPTAPTAPGFTPFTPDPEASRFEQMSQTAAAQNRADAARNTILQDLNAKYPSGTWFPSLFADQPTLRRIKHLDEISNWYKANPTARTLLTDPNLAQEAQRDSEAFYEKYKDFGRSTPADVSTPAIDIAPSAMETPAGDTLLGQSYTGGDRYTAMGGRESQYSPPPNYQHIFAGAAQAYNVPYEVLAAMGHQESRFKPDIIGPETKYGRAIGMMQYLPSTADALKIDPRNPEQSVYAAAKQIRERLDMGETLEEAIKHHHGGPDRSIWGPKTNAYAREVLDKASVIAGGGRTAGVGSVTTPSGISERKIYDSSQFYLGNPTAVTRDMQFMLNRRAQLAQYANNFMYIGTPEMIMKGMELQQQVMAMDEKMYYLQGMQGLQELALANDPRRLSAVWSEFAGVPVQIIPRADGLFDVDVNGVTMRQGVSRDEITRSATLAFSEEARKRELDMAANIGEKALEYKFWAMEKNQELFNEIQKTYATMPRDVAIEKAKQKQMDIVDTSEGVFLVDNRTGYAKPLMYSPEIPATNPLFGPSTPAVPPTWTEMPTTNLYRALDPSDPNFGTMWRGQQ